MIPTSAVVSPKEPQPQTQKRLKKYMPYTIQSREHWRVASPLNTLYITKDAKKSQRISLVSKRPTEKHINKNGQIHIP